jgi:hypothetical protein
MLTEKNNMDMGFNVLGNWFSHLNEKIPLKWFNKTFVSYKFNCKQLFLSVNQF